MKIIGVLSSVLFILLTPVAPVWADPKPAADEPELILNPRLNALVGLGDLGLEGQARPPGLGGGATVELGGGWATLETGAMVLRTRASRPATLTLPMYAKFRVFELNKQSWFVKAGGMPAFESNGFDVLLGAGVGGRIQLGRNLDLIVDGTYQHGVVDQSSAAGTNQVGGFLILTGLSFRI